LNETRLSKMNHPFMIWHLGAKSFVIESKELLEMVVRFIDQRSDDVTNSHNTQDNFIFINNIHTMHSPFHHAIHYILQRVVLKAHNHGAN